MNKCKDMEIMQYKSKEKTKQSELRVKLYQIISM